MRAVIGRGNQRKFSAAVKPYMKLSPDIFNDQVSISPPKAIAKTTRSPVKTRPVAAVVLAVDVEVVAEQAEFPPRLSRTGRILTKRRLFGA